MPRLKLLPSGQLIDFSPGDDLLQTASKGGIEIAVPCGAQGRCGRCVVKVVEGSVASESAGNLPAKAVGEGYVQACHTRLCDDDVTIYLPRLEAVKGQFAEAEDIFDRIEPILFPQEWQHHPMVTQHSINVSPPALEDGCSDLDRFKAAVLQTLNRSMIAVPLSLIKKLAGTLRSEDGGVVFSLAADHDSAQLVDLKAGNRGDSDWGLAIDIGTTTIAMQLVSFPSNRVVSVKTDYNRQLSCGEDIISRINYSQRPGGLTELQRLVLETIRDMIARMVKENDIESDMIHSAVISGNTTMIHLLLGLNPDYIRLDPYTPTVLELPWMPAEELGLDLCPAAPVHISPAVGSYVGGDITAGILCTYLQGLDDEISLFLDIGTNGELVIGNSEFLMACACSAGPAFEGGGIACGMRATQGAIESVSIDQESGQADVKTIGDIQPSGICGSGIISLLAELFRTGWLDASGKLNRDRSSDCVRVSGRQARYVLVPEEQTAGGEAMAISETEIDNIIRGKAAIFSACRLLMENVGIGFKEISRFYIAGGFGRYLNLEDCITIGLLPEIETDRFHFLGNTSLIGSYMLLISREYQQKQKELAARITYIDLSSDPNYMDQYTAALFLPHTDKSLFSAND